jgi:hypothetical protein
VTAILMPLLTGAFIQKKTAKIPAFQRLQIAAG